MAARQRYLAVRERSAAGLHEWYDRLVPGLSDELAERLTRCHLAMLDGLYVGSFGDPDWWASGAGERMLNLLSEGLHTAALRWTESS